MVTWHPILAADEPTPGRWELRDQYGRCYGVVEILTIGDDLGYRADDAAGELIGHYATLRTACREVHSRFVQSHGPAPFRGYPDFGPRRD
ncbi:hypothetical protein ABIQ69_09650 [Agromyces sp. G08B096]|uniref:DUF2188 domain-containing protein n=1 Tax=Agromyces sp. G08B096 TaxID=3156399 RepID=A0AAU7W3G7_9MICO